MKIELAQIREKNCGKCVIVMMGIEVRKSIFGNLVFGISDCVMVAKV